MRSRVVMSGGPITPLPVEVLRQMVADEFASHRLPDGSQDIGIHHSPPCGPPVDLQWDELRTGVSE